MLIFKSNRNNSTKYRIFSRNDWSENIKEKRVKLRFFFNFGSGDKPNLFITCFDEISWIYVELVGTCIYQSNEFRSVLMGQIKVSL